MEDIILVFNKTLQKIRKSALICFNRVSYSQSKAISTFFIKKRDIIKVFKTCINVLIKTTKIINLIVIGAKVLKY